MSRFRQHHRDYPYRPPRRQREDGDGDMQMYLTFIRRYALPHKWTLILCMAIVCLHGASVYLMAFYAQYVVDHILLVDAAERQEPAPPDRHLDRREEPTSRPSEGLSRRFDRAPPVPSVAPNAGRRLFWIFMLHLGTIVFLNYTARIANRNQIIIGQNIAAQLRDDLHAKILDLSLAYHKANTAGRLLARIMSDVKVMQSQLMNTLINLARSLTAIIVGAAILFWADWRMAIIALLATPLYALVWYKSRGPVRDLAKEARHTNSCMYGLISQKLDSVKAIQAYGREKRERLNFRRLSSVFLRDALCQQRQSAGVNQVSTIISTVTTMSIFIYGTTQVLAGETTLGMMLFVYGAAANLFGPVLQLTAVGVTFSRLLVILRRLVDILQEPLEIDDAPDAEPFPKPLRRGIRMDHVSFAYHTEDAPILHNVSLEIPAGQWICIMGPSGCGKTSLLYLLARLYEATTGQITVDGIPLEKLDIRSLRERMALVPQEAEMFRGTVRDNITYGYPDAQPSQIMQAAKAAEMHDLIMSLPVKYETVIGEKGSDLSGGQRQRLSLARALLTNPDVLLLDDCTSALDAATEARIQATLSHIMEGKTAVVVSQRVSMAMRCHRIIVLQDGVVTEQGSHDELLRQNGFYARLHAQQTE